MVRSCPTSEVYTSVAFAGLPYFASLTQLCSPTPLTQGQYLISPCRWHNTQFYAVLDGSSNTKSLPPALSMNAAIIGLPTLSARDFVNNTKARTRHLIKRLRIGSSYTGRLTALSVVY